MPILKIDPNDPDQERKELEFEVKCALQISQEDRITQMIKLSKRVLQLANRYASQRSYQIIKRPSS